MITRKLLYGMAIIALVFLAAGCNSVTRGSGNVISQTREVHDFSAVQFSGFGTVNVTQTGDESLTIQAEDNLMPLLTSSVVNGVLKLETQNGAGILPTKDIIYDLHVKSLSSITFSGAGSINASQLSGDSLTVDLSGAGSIKATQVSGTSLNVKLSGAGNVTLGGTVANQTVAISGVGSYDGANLDSKTAVINNSGAGKATVKVSDTLNVNITGVGSVDYIGNPTVNKSITGVGSLNQKAGSTQ